MAVGFVNSATSGAQSSVGSFNIGTLGTGARAGLVFVVTYANSGAAIESGVTWNGQTMSLLYSGADTNTEPGIVRAYFLDNVTNGLITVTRTNNTVVCVGYAISISAAAGLSLEVAQVKTVGGDGTVNTNANTSTSGTAASGEYALDDGSPGTSSMRFAASYTGNLSPLGQGTNSTALQSHDQTAYGSSMVRETNAGQGSRNVGFATGITDDLAAVAVAVREKPATIPGSFTVDAVILASSGTKSFTVDAIQLANSGTKTFTLDAEKAISSTTVPGDFTVDAVLLASSGTKTFTLDAVLLASSGTKSFTLNAILLKTQTGRTAYVNQAQSGAGVQLFGDGSGSGERLAQSFSLGASRKLNAIRWDARSVGSPTDDAVFEIVSTLEGSALTSASLTGPTFPTSSEVYDLAVSEITLTSSTTYYLRLRRSGSRDEGNYYLIRYNLTSVYPDGSEWSRSSGSWSPGSSDLRFGLLQDGFSVDAWVLTTVPDDFTADAVLLREMAGSPFTLDAVIHKNIAGTPFTLDAVLLASSGTKTFTLDAVIQKTFTRGASTVASFENTSVDDPLYGGDGVGAYEELAQAVTATARVRSVEIRAYRIGSPGDNVILALTSDRDGAPWGSVTRASAEFITNTNGAWEPFTFSTPVDVSGSWYIHLKRSGARNESAFALWNSNNSGGLGDGSQQSSGSWSSLGASHSFGFRVFANDGIVLDAELVEGAGTKTGNFTLNAVILASSGTKALTLDAVQLDSSGTKTFTVDAVVNAPSGTKTATLDAVLLKTINGTPFAVDAVQLAPSGDKTFTADAEFARVTLGDFTLDAALLREQAGTPFSLDAVILASSGTKTFTLDAVQIESLAGTPFTVDANIYRAWTKAFTTDAVVLASSGTKTATLDAQIATLVFSDDFNRTVSGGWGGDLQIVYYSGSGVQGNNLGVDGSSAYKSGSPDRYVFTGFPLISHGIVQFDFYVGNDTSIQSGYFFATLGNQYVQVNQYGADLWDVEIYDYAYFDPSPDTWYRLVAHLNQTTGKVLYAKVWPRDEPEPATWNLNGVRGQPVQAENPNWALSDVSARGLDLDSSTSGTFFQRLDNFRIWTSGGFRIRHLWAVDAVLLKSSGTKSFTADAVVQRAFTGNVSLDAVIHREQSGTPFTVDAVLLASSGTKSVTVDAELVATRSFSFATDAVLLREMVGTPFTLDAWIPGAGLGAFSVDAVVHATISDLTFTLDAVISESQAGDFTLDATLLRTTESEFALDAVALSSSGTKALTLDAVIRETQDGTFSLDALVQRTSGASVPLDAVLLATIPGDLDLDAVIQRTVAGATTADAVISATTPGSFTADAIVERTAAWTFFLDAVLLATVQPSGLTLDAWVQGFGTGAFTLDAIRLAASGALGFSLDAEVTTGETIPGNFTVQAIVSRVQSVTFSVDAVVAVTSSGSFPIDAVQLKTEELAGLLDAVVKATRMGGFATDAVLLSPQTGSFSVDAVLVGAFTLDAYIVGQNFFTLDANISRRIVQEIEATVSARTIAATLSAGVIEATTSARTIAATMYTSWHPTRQASLTLDAEIA